MTGVSLVQLFNNPPSFSFAQGLVRGMGKGGDIPDTVTQPPWMDGWVPRSLDAGTGCKCKLGW